MLKIQHKINEKIRGAFATLEKWTASFTNPC